MRSEDLDGPANRAAARFVERARGAGLIDVAYAFVPSPFGDLLVATSRRGLVRIDYPGPDPDRAIEELATELSPRVLESPGSLDPVRRELDEYFAGRRQAFDVPVDLSLVRGFTRRVLRATARIPFGELATYRDVATRAGSPAAVRAAGNALGSNPIPIVVPCHRVVRTGGGLGGYTGGLERKEFLLELEGVHHAARADPVP
ncbi:MAG: methylated-DNA--[protein]-cysteine S-methyltransferase [Actinobacteria bacterium]|nr:methylated-DNA--[protein]-cysteine S-methyltransferase [Actinomycetota bacterium]